MEPFFIESFEPKKLALICIWQILKEFSDDDRPMTQKAVEKGLMVGYVYNKYDADKELHKTSYQRVSTCQLILHNQRYYLMAYSCYMGKYGLQQAGSDHENARSGGRGRHRPGDRLVWDGPSEPCERSPRKRGGEVQVILLKERG